MNNFAWAIAGLVISLVFVVLAFTSSKIKGGGVGTRIAGLQRVFTRPLFIGLVVVVSLAVVAYWGLYTSLIPRPGDVGSWSWHHWLPLLVFFAVVWFAVELVVEKERVKKTLQRALTVVMFMLFVGASVIGWFGGVLGTTSSPRASCPAFSPNETRSCVVGTNWSNWVGTSVPTYRNQYQYCLSTGPYRIQYKLFADSPAKDWHPGELTNPMYQRFQATDGTYTVKYRLAKSCPSEL